jgi:hypothetical protein
MTARSKEEANGISSKTDNYEYDPPREIKAPSFAGP